MAMYDNVTTSDSEEPHETPRDEKSSIYLEERKGKVS